MTLPLPPSLFRSFMFFIILNKQPQRRTEWAALNHKESTGGLGYQNIHQKRNYWSASSNFLCHLLLLPVSCWGGRRVFPSSKRALMVLVLVPILFALLVIGYGGIPPSFSRIKAYENSLEQHDWSKLKFSNEHKYLSFPDHVWGHGFNNVLQEMYVSIPWLIREENQPFKQSTHFIHRLRDESYIRL